MSKCMYVRAKGIILTHYVGHFTRNSEIHTDFDHIQNRDYINRLFCADKSSSCKLAHKYDH